MIEADIIMGKYLRRVRGTKADVLRFAREVAKASGGKVRVKAENERVVTIKFAA